MKRLIFLIIMLLIFTGCVSFRGTHWQQTSLYFGMSRADGSIIRESEWQEFVDREVSSRFPAGFTVIPAEGQWQNPAGEVIKESTRLLIIMHERSPESRDKINMIRSIYKREFNQSSVLMSREYPEVEF